MFLDMRHDPPPFYDQMILDHKTIQEDIFFQMERISMILGNELNISLNNLHPNLVEI